MEVWISPSPTSMALEMSRPGGRGRPTSAARDRWRGWGRRRVAAGGGARGEGRGGQGGSRGRDKADIRRTASRHMHRCFLSHNRNVIIITILQASLRLMRAPTSTQMTTVTEAWIMTPHLPLPLYYVYPLSHCLMSYFPSLQLGYFPSLQMLPT